MSATLTIGGIPLDAPEARPRILSTEAVLAVALEMADALISDGHRKVDEREWIAADIAKWAGRRMDGYELAKQLDDRAHWDCDLMVAECLDQYQSLYDIAISAAEKAWAERNNIQPKLSAGDRVTYRRGEAGTIVGVYEHGVAQYRIRADNEIHPDCCQILRFEDVAPEVPVAS